MGESHYLNAKAAGLPDFPLGFVPRYEAAQMFGVALGTWEQWEKSGRVSIQRHKKKLSKGPPWVLYAATDLKRLLKEFRKAPAPTIPDGFVTREQAAEMFGVALRTWSTWERERQMKIKRHSVQSGAGPPWVVYRKEDVQRALEEYRNRPAPTFSPGLVTRAQAAEMFGVAVGTWDTWEREGRIPLERFYEKVSKGPPFVLYAKKDLIPLREVFRRLEEPYLDPKRPGCCRVPIRSHLHELEAIIDAADLPKVQGRAWNWDPGDKSKKPVVILASVDKANTPLKRLILGIETTELRVAHVNGDPLDCRRENLEVETPAEQLYRTRKHGIVNGRQFTSQYKGVCWCEDRGMWVAQIRKGGLYRHIGRFYEEEDAAEAYDKAARELFGDHASLNFPDAGERSAVDAA